MLAEIALAAIRRDQRDAIERAAINDWATTQLPKLLTAKVAKETGSTVAVRDFLRDLRGLSLRSSRLKALKVVATTGQVGNQVYAGYSLISIPSAAARTLG